MSDKYCGHGTPAEQRCSLCETGAPYSRTQHPVEDKLRARIKELEKSLELTTNGMKWLNLTVKERDAIIKELEAKIEEMEERERDQMLEARYNDRD